MLNGNKREKIEPEPTRVQQNVEQAIPFLWVGSMANSLKFYVEGLGFALSNEWIVDGQREWCRLQLGGAALMLQQYRPGRRPETPPGVGVSICFQCRDALAIYRHLRAEGIVASRPSVGNGMWVTVLRDPDGYKLDFESPTDAPEETELAE